ncbi:zinc knuckle CX2CX4HX4C containing protein [Tanacetum coccineum]|uniref:Zinc knuckle CX2CX4HX4C containing protein n=1 Tax=Tanacetum coccineum TaxID=301880 RepID=A0ABQ5HHD6_9ASTR
MEHRKDVRDDGSLKVSNSSHLVSLTATINMPRGLYYVDVAATFGVPLTTVGDLHLLIKSIEVGKHDELLFRMTNDECMAIMDALGAGASAKDQPKVNSNFRLLVADLVFDGVNISIPHKVVKKVDLVDVVTIGIPSLSRDDFIKKTIRVEYEWRPPRCDICKIFGHVHDHCPKNLASPPIVVTSNVVTPTVEKTSDGLKNGG